MNVEPTQAGGAMTPDQLSEVIGAFNSVTARLQQTHEGLIAEVARLRAELSAANEQVERSRRLAALGEMAAGIAHEIRNPLASIGLHARMLSDDLGGQPEQKAVAERIRSGVRQMDAVVVDVLAFAREMATRPSLSSAATIMSAAIDEVRADAAAWNGLRIVRHDLNRPDVEVWCDVHLMHRALVNVIRNAIEAMHEAAFSGEKVLEVDVQCGGDMRMRTFIVKDHGPGVAPEVMSRIFNPFFTTRAAGTGLGLAIVHRIVDAHAGRISVRNHGEREAVREDGGPRSGAVVELSIPMPDEAIRIAQELT